MFYCSYKMIFNTISKAGESYSRPVCGVCRSAYGQSYVVEQEPQTFLEGKLLVSNAKRRQVEIKDILSWTEAFTIFQLVLCATFPLHWLDLTKYKLLIIQTAHQHPGLASFEYDLVFRRDAAASGLND